MGIVVLTDCINYTGHSQAQSFNGHCCVNRLYKLYGALASSLLIGIAVLTACINYTVHSQAQSFNGHCCVNRLYKLYRALAGTVF